MTRKAVHLRILDKAKEAALAAISCYNQPNFTYREESFCILMINAWELLFKAKIIKDNNGSIKSVYVEDTHAKRKDGKAYAKPRYQLNKAGNNITIGFKAILAKHEQLGLAIEQNLKSQLEILHDFRNAAIHFAKSGLESVALGVFTATLKSFRMMCDEWFDEKISDNLMLIPLAFDLPNHLASSITNEDAKNLLLFIAHKEQNSENNGKHNIRVNVQLKFERSKEGFPIRLGKNGVPMTINTEDHLKNKYPWSYTDNLIPNLKGKYQGFKQDRKFYTVLKGLKKDPRYCIERYLDPIRKKGAKKEFYSPDIVNPIAQKLGLTSL